MTNWPIAGRPEARDRGDLVTADAAPADLVLLAAIDAGGRADSLAGNTRRAYASRWALFQEWCVANRLCPVPAEATTVRSYVAQLRSRGLGMSTITQTLAAIWAQHTDAGIDAPARIDTGLRQALAGYARQDAKCPTQQRTALLVHQTRHIFTVMDTTLDAALTATGDLRVRHRHRLIDVRDRAVILTGLATALRRAELVRLQVSGLPACRFATPAARGGASRTAIMTDGGWSSAAVDRYIRRGTLWEDAAASRIFT